MAVPARLCDAAWRRESMTPQLTAAIIALCSALTAALYTYVQRRK